MRPGQPVTFHRRLSGTRADPGPRRQRAARIRHGVLAAAGPERHRQLREDRAARAGEDRHRQSAAPTSRSGPACRSSRACASIPRPSIWEQLTAASEPYERRLEGYGAGCERGRQPRNPWLIAVVVALAAFMEVLDTTIANVALPYIAGGLGVSEDEASWVVTTYLVSNAVIVTASSFLAKKFGRKTFFLICLACSPSARSLCGLPGTCNTLLLFRVLQGFGGGGMVPVAQSILADSFPPEKRGQAFALFGVAVVVAPVVGPTLGGWLSDNWSWHWCFLINGPVGLMTIALIGDPAHPMRREDAKAVARGSASIRRLPAGRDSSARSRSCSIAARTTTGSARRFIVEATAVSALAFLLMIPWELSRRIR